MHTRAEVRPEHYKYFIDGKEVGLSDIFDGFEKDDRIGIVSRSPGGTLGISALFMAAVSNYYEHFFEEGIVGNETEKLRIYPEYFIFHVGKETGSSGQIDVWPPNKEVVVEDDSEQILEALNDRGINILLLEESDEKSTNFLRESISSAKSRVRKVLMFSPSGKIEDGDIKIVSNGSFSKFALKAYEETAEMLSQTGDSERIPIAKEIFENGGEVTQIYRTTDIETAIRSLSNEGKTGENTRRYIDNSAKGAGVRL